MIINSAETDVGAFEDTFDSGYSDHSDCSATQYAINAIGPQQQQQQNQQRRLSHAQIARLVKWSLPPPITIFDIPGWQPMPYGMEQYWLTAFTWFFHSFWETDSHLWTLQPVDVTPDSSQWMWHSASYSAKVRFQCQKRHGWTSMKGRVSFWFRIRREQEEIKPEAVFKYFGQKCNRCQSRPQVFVSPLWYHEEIENAMRYLSLEVANTYYGGKKEPTPRRLRRGHPQSHHDVTCCEACLQGFCSSSQRTAINT